MPEQSTIQGGDDTGQSVCIAIFREVADHGDPRHDCHAGQFPSSKGGQGWWKVVRGKEEAWQYLLVRDDITVGTSPLKSKSTVRTLNCYLWRESLHAIALALYIPLDNAEGACDVLHSGNRHSTYRHYSLSLGTSCSSSSTLPTVNQYVTFHTHFPSFLHCGTNKGLFYL